MVDELTDFLLTGREEDLDRYFAEPVAMKPSALNIPLSTTRAFLNIYFQGKDCEVKCRMLYDTGACSTLMSIECFKEIKGRHPSIIGPQLHDHGLNLIAANQLAIPIIGVFMMTTIVLGMCFRTPLIVTETRGKHGIVGMNLIRQLGLTFDMAKDEFFLTKEPLARPPPDTTDGGRRPSMRAYIMEHEEATPATLEGVHIGCFTSHAACHDILEERLIAENKHFQKCSSPCVLSCPSHCVCEKTQALRRRLLKEEMAVHRVIMGEQIDLGAKRTRSSVESQSVKFTRPQFVLKQDSHQNGSGEGEETASANLAKDDSGPHECTDAHQAGAGREEGKTVLKSVADDTPNQTNAQSLGSHDDAIEVDIVDMESAGSHESYDLADGGPANVPEERKLLFRERPNKSFRLAALAASRMPSAVSKHGRLIWSEEPTLPEYKWDDVEAEEVREAARTARVRTEPTRQTAHQACSCAGSEASRAPAAELSASLAETTHQQSPAENGETTSAPPARSMSNKQQRRASHDEAIQQKQRLFEQRPKEDTHERTAQRDSHVAPVTKQPKLKAFSVQQEKILRKAIKDDHCCASPGVDPGWSANLTLTRSIIIQPGVAKLAKVRVMCSNKSPIKNQCVYTEVEGSPTAILTDKDGNASLYLANPGFLEIGKTAGDVLASARSLHGFHIIPATEDNIEVFNLQEESAGKEGEGCDAVYRSELSTVQRDLINQAVDKSKLGPEEKSRLFKLLCKYPEVISEGRHDLGRTTTMHHSIRVPSGEIVYNQQFQIPVKDLEFIKESAREWLKSGVIRPANSRYNSAVFVVPKPGGGQRVVVDLRRVNAASMLDRYSIRSVDQCIAEVGQSGADTFTSLDLASGFWQLPLDEESRKYTCFTIPGWGQFEWTVAPMGAHGSPASFSRLMEIVVKGLSNTISYIDDLLLYSKGFQESLLHLDRVLQRLRTHKLKLNIGKCTFAAKGVAYLGAYLSGDGVRPGRVKTQAIKDMAAPLSQKSLLSFLGLTNYFRNYVRGFSEMAAPLNALTRLNSAWSGGRLPPAAMKAFHEIKAALTSEPVLAYVNTTGRFHLYVDAAKGDDKTLGGLGAALMQEQKNGEIKPVYYASRGLREHEKNYTSFLLELQAIHYGIEQFRPHLKANPFTVHTDNKPLVEVSKTHTKTLDSLKQKMCEFNFDLLYVKGKDNTLADYLSRIPGYTQKTTTKEARELGEDVNLDMVDALHVNTSSEHIKNMQQHDDECVEIVRQLLANEKITEWTHVPGTLFVDRRGLLKIELKGTMGKLNKGKTLAIAPTSMRLDIIFNAHNHKLAGHVGEERTVEKVQETFWWPGMGTEIAHHIKACITCGRLSTKHTVPSPMPLHPLKIPAGPNDRLHIDLHGPVYVSEKNQEYILIARCAFSKFVTLTAIPDKKAVTVANALFADWISYFSCPRRIFSDRGKEFLNDVLKRIFEICDIEHSTTYPAFPQANSAAESINSTLIHTLATIIEDNRGSATDWPELLPGAQLMMNSVMNTQTKQTPIQTMLGFAARIPTFSGQEDELKQYEKEEAWGVPKTIPELELGLRRTRESIRRTAELNLIVAQETYKADYDKRNRVDYPCFKVGDAVWVRCFGNRKKNPKLQPKWDFGFIQEIPNSTSCIVHCPASERRAKTFTVANNHIRPRILPLG